MAESNNLGYTTHVLSTVKSITECKKILVYNRNSFINNPNYSRLTLYNIDEIFNNVLIDDSKYGYNENCLLLDRSDYITEEGDITNIPFQYNCTNTNTPNGFNIIIYLSNVDNSPTGFTEFVNTQGRISERINIFLKFNIKGIELKLGLLNSLYEKRNLLNKDFIGTGLSEYTSNFIIENDINKINKDSKYTTHLSSYLNENNNNNIYLNDRFLNSNRDIIKLNLENNYDFGLGVEFEKHQLTYYGEDIVMYSWLTSTDMTIKYQIVSAISSKSYIYSDFYDTIPILDEKVLSQDVLYCAGKYIVVRIGYNNKTKIKLFDTENINWVDTIQDNVIIDPFDKTAEIYELPKPSSFQTLDSAYFLFPELVNVYLNLKDYIKVHRELDIVRKIGNWIIIKNKKAGKTFYIATNMFSVIYMTEDDYNNMIVINESTLLLREENYYIIYYGIRLKTYYTERARSLNTGIGLTQGIEGILFCNDDESENYTEMYNKKEIGIVIKGSNLFDSILNQFRKGPLKKLVVPSNIVCALGGIIYYKENNKLSYI